MNVGNSIVITQTRNGRDIVQKIPRYQFNALVCSKELKLIDDTIEYFVSDVNRTLLKIDKDQYMTQSGGHIIHKSCFDNFGKGNFLNAYNKAFGEGFSCLKRLEEKFQNKKGRGGSLALKNALKLQSLWENGDNPLSIVCNEFNVKSDGIMLSEPGEIDSIWVNNGKVAHAARASSDASDETGTGVSHPFISINPFFKIKSNLSEKKVKRLYKSVSASIFHEALHNIGYVHGEPIEVAYSCETCCMNPREKSKKTRDLACKICTGDYKGPDDMEYKLDILQFSNAEGVTHLK